MRNYTTMAPLLVLLPLLGACTEARRPRPARALPQSAQSFVAPYGAGFGYGCNLGYYGPGWTDEQLAAAARAAGSNTIRVTLPEQFLTQWGFGARQATFAYYHDSLGMRDLVCFVGEPAPEHRDPVVYPGCQEPSRLFANLYEPIWQADGRINPANYYAGYMHRLVQRYGSTVRIWEVVNEPDFVTDRSNEQWLDRAPEPAETPNTRAPIYRYIRMLRITWEVVKKYQPQAYVTPGGLGYPEYLDALLRYTDNPRDGAATAEYPATGGAFFDVLDYHVYPSYYLRQRNWRQAGRFAYRRHSDAAAAQVVAHKNAMQAVLQKYGYDGETYPRKHFVVSETNISRRPAEWRYSSDEMQRNFGMKALILAQKNGIRQLHFFQLGEKADAPSPGTTVGGPTEFDLMGLYQNLPRAVPGSSRLTPLGQGVRTTATLLRGLAYDAARTAALHLPAAVEGAVFSQGPRVVYVLWARTTTDQSEAVTATYALPATTGLRQVREYAWNYSAGTGSRPVVRAAQRLVLSGTPAFFTAATPADALVLRLGQAEDPTAKSLLVPAP
ncbi:hypothetical protein [Hymenobacter metallicola]|uniref:Glycoside hydrolase family 5 domain-containing protein n=1 Tax=Hymenobacter metallicola TaxID=2563114 RepID=A0A4Z0QI42_9BACT|nr:hypothetical protein [Hymenobacter metallicola]TGE28671.1 hypothetical protein E5K02_04170 [Hymenobacter metallicola]